MGLLGDVLGGITSIIGGNSSKNASKAAQAAQIAALNQAMTAQNVGYGRASDALSPYTDAGSGAQAQINSLLGISSPGQANYAAYVQNSPDLLAEWNRLSQRSDNPYSSIEDYGRFHYQKYGQAEGRQLPTSGASDGSTQQAAIDQVMASPYYQSLYGNGQEALLANAAATGGLRGGNVQRSLANFGRDTLSQAIQQQLSNLSGVANTGLQAAGGVANAATGVANNISNLNTQIGDTQAGGILQRATINANTINQVGKSIGNAVTDVASAFGGGGGFNIGDGGLNSSNFFTLGKLQL